MYRFVIKSIFLEIMGNILYEVVKEYKTTVDGLDFDIKGRVLKRVEPTGDLDYMWEISHHCKPGKDAATIYYPSTINAQTFEEAKMLLFSYMVPFTIIEVVENKFY